MQWQRIGWTAGAIGALALVAGCGTRQPPPPPVTAQPVPRPVPPGGAAVNIVLPPRNADGSYRTINDGVGRDEAIWHVRSALNVAALSCVGAGNAQLVADYNALLGQRKAVFNTAYKAETGAHKDGGHAALDRHMTQLYNFFAQPPAQAGFCAVARQVATEARAAPAAGFADFAVAALPRLSAPFDQFYRAYAGYQVELAAWEKGPRTVATPAATSAAPLAFASAAPASRTAAAMAGPSAWRIQLGAFSGQAAAEQAWAKIHARLAGVNGFRPQYQPVPGKALVRVQVGPLSDRASAIRLCAAAAAADFDCLPVPS
ncbi:Sporulation related domain-containing protein [Sphingomonas laterariae]|uniref:Sporulation related domain-containing protein n=1 Tax=Edaphosphingomonas laterariae TaxID=861865 RepID=A0A239DXC0_9SPHN|nr:SPOR domain-containing protein [Sphingomonas laterariae]SNS36997.1 Sporulation related domain-containing protein [Sphingomonas laterariae]